MVYILQKIEEQQIIYNQVSYFTVSNLGFSVILSNASPGGRDHFWA
jgi:hypothetical protein